MKKKTIFLLFYLIIFIMPLYAAADSKEYVENLVKNQINTVLSVINDKNLQEQAKKDKIFTIAAPLFDFYTMSKLALGEEYWKKLSDSERKDFSELFKKRIKLVYLNRLSIDNIKVQYSPPIEKGPKLIYVPSVFTSKDKNFNVLFKLWNSPNDWKIYDVETEGISIVKTYKSQFADILNKGSIKDLFKKLEDNNQ